MRLVEGTRVAWGMASATVGTAAMAQGVRGKAQEEVGAEARTENWDTLGAPNMGAPNMVPHPCSASCKSRQNVQTYG